MEQHSPHMEWSISKNYSGGLPALILVGPSAHATKETYVACSYRSTDTDSMRGALTTAGRLTQEYRVQGFTVSDTHITLQHMMAL
jgi:hypothetical protein